MHTVHLTDFQGDTADLVRQVDAADAILLSTGVYWGNHGSPMQRFFEVMTAWEATPVFLGKPAAALVTMDSVGGTDVAARLLHTCNLLGCSTAPLASVVLSRLGVHMGAVAAGDDVWQCADMAPLLDNLLHAAATSRVHWRAWDVHATPPTTGAYPTVGALHVDHEPWLTGSRNRPR